MAMSHFRGHEHAVCCSGFRVSAGQSNMYSTLIPVSGTKMEAVVLGQLITNKYLLHVGLARLACALCSL